MARSDNLRKAKSAKNDEFYTRLEDIEAEISMHDDYVRQFQGKTVFCNCDDPEWSNFFVFFKIHFKQLGLKKLITTHFNMDGSPSYKLEWCGEMLNEDMVNLIKTPLEGNGDFRSEECIEILEESDIVVTNPPFSIARESFIPMLYQHEKKFVIIGDLNWVAYKTVFPLFKDAKMFFGYTAVKSFLTPDKSIQKFGNKCWFTNFDLDKSHEPLILTKNYYGNEDRYPRYDNYDAIECGKVKDIPKDYFPCWYDCPHAGICEYAKTEGKEKNKAICEMARNGEIGVPITYLAGHCEEQMEIVGSDNDFAIPMSEIDPDGIYTKGGPAFYLKKDLTRYMQEANAIKTRQDKTRQDKTRQDKTRQEYRRLYNRVVIRRKKTL